ncbi:MAG: hypothetical protein J3K34DRAFT_477893 [Monoraphidium minutum]|nr:MAG: hypothetical protein J3K34DRAFT_477893 [Monoraphidium minutum]
MAALPRSASYQRITSHGHLAALAHPGAPGHAAHGGCCRPRAARAAARGLPLLLACVLSSLLTLSSFYGLRQHAAGAAAAARLDALTSAGHAAAAAGEPGGRLWGFAAAAPGGSAALPEQERGGSGWRGGRRRGGGEEDRAALRLAAAQRLLGGGGIKHRSTAAVEPGARVVREPAAPEPAAAERAAAVLLLQQQQQKPPEVLPKAAPVGLAVLGPAAAVAPAGAAAAAAPAHAPVAPVAAAPAAPAATAVAVAAISAAAAVPAGPVGHRARGRARARAAAAAPPLAPPRRAGRYAEGPAPPPYGASGRTRVALVNHAPYHLEIVAGWLAALRQLPVEVVWYQAGQYSPDRNFTAAELLETQGFHELVDPSWYHILPVEAPAVRVDFAVFVSPEYYEAETKAFLDAALPISSVMLVHNGCNSALARLEALAPRAALVALAPHVAAAARANMSIPVDWAMATLPFKPKEPCTLAAAAAARCLDGFAIQGNFEPARRNYSRVWGMLQARAARGQLPTRPPLRPLRLHLIGRGVVEHLGLPGDVESLATVHFNELYAEYYEQIHRAHALLLVLGSPAYLASKMSSTVVSALTAGVPVVADAAALRAYSFLPRDAVFLMAPGEDEAGAMMRVLAMRPEDVLRVHARVAEVSASLNARTLRLLKASWMPRASEVRNRHEALHIPFAEA